MFSKVVNRRTLNLRLNVVACSLQFNPITALTEHDGLHVLDDDLPGHGGGAVKHDVLDALPVQSLQLPDEEDSVIRRPDLPRRLNRESGGTKCILSVNGNFYILHL